MQRWRSDPLPLPVAADRVTRLDLEFERVRRGEGSFTVFVFLNAADDLPLDADRDHPSFGAAFTVFAHERCYGDEGHCEWRKEPVSPFDRRPQHHLTPVNINVDVTDALRRIGDPSAIVATVHARRMPEPEAQDVFRFERLSLLAYQ